MVGVRGGKSSIMLGVRTLVSYERDDTALTPERISKVLETRTETPGLPSCLDPVDRYDVIKPPLAPW